MKNKKEQTKSTSETDVSKAEWCIRALDGNELNAPKQSGLYHVTMTHSDVVNAGLPAELCNENHNIKALLLVSENNGKANRQKDKHIFQMLIFGSCKSSATNIYSRSCTYADGAPQWDEWVKMVDNGMLKSELREFKDKMLVPVTWDANSHADTFVAPGTYNLTGERLNLYDGLPIANAAPGHTINAHLVVLDSSISGTGESDDKCITQILTLSNRTSGDGDVYIRTGRAASLAQLADGNAWEQWGKLQQNVEVGQVTSLNAFIDNGIYSGLYTNGSTFFETFVMVVINNYAVAGATGRVRSISQFKYALGIDGNFSYKTRTARGGDELEWGSWVDLGAADTSDIQDGAITAQKLSAALLEQINQNTANATKAANGAYWTFGPNAVTLNINKNDGTVGWQTLSAATDENAGVMTAEDKKEQVKKTPLLNGDTIVGLAREVYSRQGKTDTATFLHRTTAGGTSISDGVATLKQIGGSIVKNIMPRMVSTVVNIKYNIEEIDGIFKISAKDAYTEDTTGSSYIGYKSLPFVKGHSYYVATTCFRNSDSNQITLILGFNGVNVIDRLVLPGIPANEWHYVSGIKVVSGDNITANVSIYPFGITNNPMTAEPLLLRGGINIVDLTEMYGAGNEPTQEECDKMFGAMDALPQGLTIAQPTGLKSVGYNQWNPENVLEYKSIAAGNIIGMSGSHIAVVECLPCKTGAGENNGYVIGYGEGDTWSDEGIEVYLTPLNPLEAEGELYMHKLEKDAATGTYVPQIKGYLLIVTPTTDKLCAHFFWSGDRATTDYEEYIESDVALPVIPEMSEWGLAGIGGVTADSIDLDRMVYTKRIGCVDIGTLSWYRSESTRFTSTALTNLTKKSGCLQIACDRYTVLPSSAIKETLINSGYTDIISPVVYDNNINVITSVEYASSSEFVAAVSGIKLYYELAEPIEYTILVKAASNYIGSDYGVEEFTGSKVPLVANILFYMRSLVSETRNFLDRLMAGLGTSDATAVADKIIAAIAPSDTSGDDIELNETGE